MSFVKKAVVWLGLNEEYPADERAHVEAPRAERSPITTTDATPSIERPRPADRAAAGESNRFDAGPAPMGQRRPRHDLEGTVRAIPMEQDAPAAELSGTVRPVPIPKTTKPQVIIPKSFNDAQDVADRFKEANPVIVNMQSADRDLARRLIDFSSGLCYGLGGQMERVAEQVYLLTPDEVEVSDEERQRYSS